jgi:hypothetical protein
VRSGDQSNFYLTDRMENALKLKEIDEGRAFASVYTFDDIYTYLDGPFLNFLLDESLPNNGPRASAARCDVC